MHPAFRSTKSALAFCGLLAFLLALPVIVSRIGLPSREQAYSSVSTHAGAAGNVVESIYEDPRDADILFLGASLVRRGILDRRIQDALSSHLGRPAHVVVLAMSSPGADLPYFLLRDYLNRHHPRLVIWNQPEPNSSGDQPHRQAYRWMRYGEYNDVFVGLGPFSRAQVYADMVLGAPRALLSKVRPNLLSDQDKSDWEGEDVRNNIMTGYKHTKFVRDTLLRDPKRNAVLMPVTSSLLRKTGPVPREYQLHFLRSLAALALQKRCNVVLLHIPTDSEYGEITIPEIADWSQLLGPRYQLIGVPSSDLFLGVERDRFLHFYSDVHLNDNGREVFTASIIPAVLKAYDESN
jgi:hypothetical protein